MARHDVHHHYNNPGATYSSAMTLAAVFWIVVGVGGLLWLFGG